MRRKTPGLIAAEAKADAIGQTLTAGDFRGDRVVRLRTIDGHESLIPAAFALRHGPWFLILSEHHGSRVYHADEVENLCELVATRFKGAIPPADEFVPAVAPRASGRGAGVAAGKAWVGLAERLRGGLLGPAEVAASMREVVSQELAAIDGLRLADGRRLSVSEDPGRVMVLSVGHADPATRVELARFSARVRYHPGVESAREIHHLTAVAEMTCHDGPHAVADRHSLDDMLRWLGAWLVGKFRFAEALPGSRDGARFGRPSS